MQYLQNKDKLRGYARYFLLILVVLSAILVIRQDYEKRELHDKLLSITEHNETIESKYDSLRDKTDEVMANQVELLNSLEPFERIARTRYPGLNVEEALTQLASDITKLGKSVEGLKPKIICVSERAYKDTSTSLITTRYRFRSQPSETVRDVYVKIRFNQFVIKASARIRGAFVIDQGSRMNIDKDSSGLTYEADLLTSRNDIEIEVISKEPLNIISMDLYPNGQR